MSGNGPRVYRDKDDDLWLDPGDGELLALDGQVLRVLRGKWPTRPLADIEEEFGPLRELTVPVTKLTTAERLALMTVPPGLTDGQAVGGALTLAENGTSLRDRALMLEACGLIPMRERP